MRRPDFLIIGGQKCGTTWMWRMLESHPDANLPQKKEIHYFGGVENYRKGAKWYYDHFSSIGEEKITGEASTTYFVDRMPYWYNLSHEIEYDQSLPSIPEIIYNEMPKVKIIAVLRNPVKRAISAYQHLLRVVAKNRGVVSERLSVLWGLKKIALISPKTRILEYGFYSNHLLAWFDVFPPEQMKFYIFEDDVINKPQDTIKDLYSFLGIDTTFVPPTLNQKYNISWGYISLFLTYFLPKNFKRYGLNRITRKLDNTKICQVIKQHQIDEDFLQEVYKYEKEKVESILKRTIPW